MKLNWLSDFAKGWCDRLRQGRLPHAVLLAGPSGVGKRAAANWIVARRLGLSDDDLPVYPFSRPEHADLKWIEIPEDKKTIGVDQIRELVGAFGLTSYEGGGKTAVIEPANAMTTNAANSLLKTLEEPPGDALIILITDKTGRLPATIFSRCQRIDLAPPALADGLAWLDRLQPGAAWADALRDADNAPLGAIAALETLDTSSAMARDFAALANGRGSPLDVASNWAGMEPLFVLDWLARQVRLAILAISGGRARAPGLAVDESVLRHIDRRNLFCYLDIINRLRGQPEGSWNVQLTFEALLIDWASGLGECGET